MRSTEKAAEQLEQIIGARAMARLVRALPDRVIRVPRVTPSEERRLRRVVLEALDCNCGEPRHHSYTAVARRLRVNRITVYRIGKSSQ